MMTGYSGGRSPGDVSHSSIWAAISSLPGSADDFVPSCARWKQFGFGSQALCFFGKAGLKGFGFFETAMQT